MKEPNSSEYALDLHHRYIRKITGFWDVFIIIYKCIKVRTIDLSNNEIEVIEGLDVFN